MNNSQTKLCLLNHSGTIAFGKKVDNIFTEHEGCRIMTDLALAAFQDNVLMMLGDHETWTPNYMHITPSTVLQTEDRSGKSGSAHINIQNYTYGTG